MSEVAGDGAALVKRPARQSASYRLFITFQVEFRDTFFKAALINYL